MKWNVFIFAVIFSFQVFPQQQSLIIDMNKKLNSQFNINNNSSKNAKVENKVREDKNLAKNEKKSYNSPIVSAVFNRISSSSDIFGSLYSNSKPLNYNRYVNTVTYIQTNSPTYSASVNNNKGTIITMIGKNNGNNWDSTCVYTDAINLGQTPQGGIYNPPGNTSLANAYIVAMGPTKTGTTVTGNFYSSKPIGAVGTNVPGADKQFFSNTPPYNSVTSPLMKKHDFSRYSFKATNDGIIRSAGMLFENANGDSADVQNVRGGTISKGVFNAGVFVWTIDSFVPPCITKSNGVKQLWNQSYMAFNEAGTFGYYVLIGARQGALNNNKGWQPLVYKTSNSGNTWALVNGIDFNSSAFAFALNSLEAVQSNTVLKVPFFNPAEGIDLTIDVNNKLHLVSTLLSTAKSHNDSLSYIHQFNLAGKYYNWKYENTKWPYIFDFVGDGASVYSCKVIDSVGTEIPGNNPSIPGFSDNPWANQSQTVAVSSGMRIQVTRTYDGQSIVYSWAESDTLFTTNGNKYNELPNVAVRALRVCDDQLSLDKYYVTSPATGFNLNVRDKAYFHNLSPVVSECFPVSSQSLRLKFPVVVSNNQMTDANSNINHYFSNVEVQFTLPTSNCWFMNYGCGSVDVKEFDKMANVFSITPNPSNGFVNIKTEMDEPFNLKVKDISGRLIFEIVVKDKNSQLNLSELKDGIYLIEFSNKSRILGAGKLVLLK